MQNAQTTRRWRWGVNRWFVLLFVLLGVLAARAYPPVRPHVQLPAEALSSQPLFTLPGIGPFYLTNTLVAVLIADVILVLMALAVRRALVGGNLVLKGLPAAIETVLEALYNLTESTAGKWARRIFPIVGTIVLLVLVVNWMELIPGVDSIGVIHPAEQGAEGHPVQQLTQIGGLSIQSLVRGDATTEGGFSLIPFVRVASTDLNFTIALALISVVLIQVFGFWANGFNYLSKFINLKGLVNKPFFGVIDFGVGLLELVSEFSKVISFSFRLFGNIFAGSVLLFVIGYLVPVLAQTVFLGLEFGVGLIQAIVFGMLTMIFIAQATAGHGHEEAAN